MFDLCKFVLGSHNENIEQGVVLSPNLFRDDLPQYPVAPEFLGQHFGHFGGRFSQDLSAQDLALHRHELRVSQALGLQANASQAQMSQGQTSQAQTSQAQTSQAQSSQAQSSQAQSSRDKASQVQASEGQAAKFQPPQSLAMEGEAPQEFMAHDQVVQLVDQAPQLQPEQLVPALQPQVEAPQAGPSSGQQDQGNWLTFSELMGDSYPAKSRIVYLKSYRLFERFLRSRNKYEPGVPPTEVMVLNYFHYLRNELKWAPSTLWSTYARINAVLSRVHGVRLQNYSRVCDVLKSYGGGYIPKQAAIFTPQQIEDFVTDPSLSSKYWLVRKVVCLLGYFGGFRSCELKSLKFENCELDSMGYWFTFKRSKQRGRLEPTTICVPRRQADWIPVASDSTRISLDLDPASLLDLYLEEIQVDLGVSRDELKGDFFRSTHGVNGKKFTNISIGKNAIGKVGIEIAKELCLVSPERFTGHCWRRSCGTSASDSGVNVTTLMSMMGWSNPKTAMVYVNRSRSTSLTMSLYLANVQRRNCTNPFPKTVVEKRQAVSQAEGKFVVNPAKSVVAKCSNTLAASSSNRSKQESEVVVKSSSSTPSGNFESDDIDLATQDLIREIEFEEGLVEGKETQAVVETVKIEKSTSRNVEETPTVVVNSESNVGSGEVVSGGNSSGQFSGIDARLANILQNLNNSGNMTIHFHFDGDKK